MNKIQNKKIENLIEDLKKICLWVSERVSEHWLLKSKDGRFFMYIIAALLIPIVLILIPPSNFPTLTIGLTLYIFIFLAFSLIVYRKIRPSYVDNIPFGLKEKKRIKEAVQIISISATVVILFTSLYAALAIKKENEVQVKNYLCLEYEQNLKAIKQIKEEHKKFITFDKAYAKKENIPKDLYEYSEEKELSEDYIIIENNNGDIVGLIKRGSFMSFNQYFSKNAIENYFENGIGLFNKIEKEIYIDYTKINITNEKMNRYNIRNSYSNCINESKTCIQKEFDSLVILLNDLYHWTTLHVETSLLNQQKEMGCPINTVDY